MGTLAMGGDVIQKIAVDPIILHGVGDGGQVLNSALTRGIKPVRDPHSVYALRVHVVRRERLV